MKNVLFATALLFAACSEKAADTIIRVDAGADATQEIVPRVAVSRVIPLAGDVPVGKIHKTVVWNDRYYLFSKNDSAITCFDGDGRYLFQIAARGRGPQEYVGMTNFFIDETDRELKVLSLDGDLVSFSPDEGSFIRRESTGYLMINDAFAIDDRTAALSIMGPDWNIEIRHEGEEPTFLLPFNELRDFVISRKRFAREGRDVFLTYGQNDNIYSLIQGTEGRDTVRVSYSVDFGPLAIPGGMYDDPDAVMARQEAGDFASNLDDLNVTRDWVTFSYWYFPRGGEIAMPNVIFDRRTGATYNLPNKDFYLLPAATTTSDGSFVSVVHPVAILSDAAAPISNVTSVIKTRGIMEDDNPVVIVWKLP